MRRLLHRGDQQGMTLIELVVAMGLMSLLMALVATMFVGTMRSFGDQRGSVTNSRMASTAMNEVTRIIRAGTEIPVYGSVDNTPVFLYAGAEQIIMHSFIDAGVSTDPPPLKVQFARNANNELVETRWEAYHVHTTYWAFQTTTDYSRVVARSLLAPSTTKPLFQYYDKDDNALVPAAGESLTTAQIRNIASVTVTMQVQSDGSGRVAPIVLQNQVGLPNLGVARVEVH
ncbi:type II secretion system protein J [Microbacterium sp.]|uniref:PulJ/GspJ family protein n=1 Tax=Microbacterium sp. TaxID=51671 RepID=UPI0039E3EA07